MTPSLALLTLVGVLALGSATVFLWIVWDAFQDSWRQGLMALLVPGYAVWYGWTRFSHWRRHVLVASALAALAAAGLGALFAVAAQPEPTLYAAFGGGGSPAAPS